MAITIDREHLERGLQILAARGWAPPGNRISDHTWAVPLGNNAFAWGKAHRAEEIIAASLARREVWEYPALEIPEDVWGDMHPDATQAAALETVADRGVLVLTGGPGVGKSTVARTLLRMFRANRLRMLCCAPTGKAAKRLQQQTGFEAATIHRTLGLIPGRPPLFNSEAQLPCDVLVVDEASMIDAGLFATLIAAVPVSSRLLIIGDTDQLPPIGAGRPLFDLLQAKVPMCRLTTIHRQASESRIPYVARDINSGLMPDVTPALNRTTDVAFNFGTDPAHVENLVLDAVFSKLQDRRGFSPDQVQVIAAQYGEGEGSDELQAAGIVSLNIGLQLALNRFAAADEEARNAGRPGRCVAGGRRYMLYPGDKVIVTKTDYKLEVFNGDIGQIVDVAPGGFEDLEPDTFPVGANPKAQICQVQFADGRKVYFTKSGCWTLDLAYCVSVHKMQGSQAPCVVVAAPSNHGMLSRALLYTALTRAEKFALIVTEHQALGRAIQNTRGSVRRTTLQSQLEAAREALDADAGEAAEAPRRKGVYIPEEL